MSGSDTYSGVSQERRHKRRSTTRLPAFLLFVVAYFLAIKSAEHLYGSLSVPSPFWVPDAVLLVALLLVRRKSWWFYLAATLPIHLAAGAPPGTPTWLVLSSAVNGAFKAFFAAWLLQRVLRRPVRLRTLREFMMFLAIAAVVAPLLSAVVGAVGRHMLGDPFWRAGYMWFLGNALAQVIITPTLLYCGTMRTDLGSHEWKEMALLSLGLGAVLYYAFLIPHAVYSPLFLYAPLPFLIIAAVRLRPLGTALALSLVAFVSILSAVQGRGFFSGSSASQNVLSMQFFLLLASIPLLALAILVQERQLAESDVRKVQTGLKEAQRLAGLGNWEWYPETNRVVCSEELYRLAGLDPRSPVPAVREMSRFFTGESWERLRQAVEESLRNGEPYELDAAMIRHDGSTGWLTVRGEVQRESGRVVRLRGTCQDITARKHAEDELRESEDKLSLLLDSTAEGIYGVDLDGCCTFCNPACVRALGFKRAVELLGRNMHELIHHTHADGTSFRWDECGAYRAYREGDGSHIDHTTLWRADGTSFPAEYWSYPQRKGQVVVGAVIAFVDITQRKLAEQALSRVSQRLIEAQEQERARIARELHDDIGQRLALLAVEFEQLQMSPSGLSTDLRARMEELQSQTGQIATDIQSLSRELHSSKLEYLGVTTAMKALCRDFGEQQKVEVDFSIHDLPVHVPADISLCLFRVLQEALHNSAKHSGSRMFEVRLWGSAAAVELTVKDSGSGFDAEAAKKGQGLGLISMEERLRLLNGTFSIKSQPGQGTTIHARVPVHPENDSKDLGEDRQNVA